MAVIAAAADNASVEGLEGITLGRLAKELRMSKAGVIGQFGTKETLQLAALDYAADDFKRRVWEPAADLEPGLPRLLGICEAWARYANFPTFSGGCFIAAAQFEWDGRLGRVHDEVAKFTRRWRKTLMVEIEAAIEVGDLAPDLDSAQVAFALEALAAGVNPSRQMHHDEDAPAWCLAAMHAVLRLPPLQPMEVPPPPLGVEA